MSSVRNFATDDHSDRLVDVEDTSMSAVDKKLGEDLFFSSKDDAILALDSDNSPE